MVITPRNKNYLPENNAISGDPQETQLDMRSHNWV